MEHYFLDLFQTHFAAWKHWGYVITFAVAFIESIPLLGMLIPGQIFIILAGFLVKLGLMSFPTALLISAVGAMLGDLVGFQIGRRYKKIPNWVYNFIKKEHLEKTQHLIETHSTKTIFIGRLHSLTRTITPFAAGTTTVSFRKFIAADLLSAFIWAFLSLGIGFVFGKSFELAAAFIGKFILVATIIVIVLVFLVKFLQEHRHRISMTDASIYATCASSLYLFAVTAHDIESGRLFHILDIRTAQIIEGLREPLLTFIMTFLTTLGNPATMTIVTVLLATWLAIHKRFAHSALTLVTMGGGTTLLYFLKATFEKVRPSPMLIHANGSSFPSGHAMMAIVFAGILSYTLIRHIKHYQRKDAAYYAVFALAISIGLSRVYLNVHWASDVIAGIFAGGFFVTFSLAIFRFIEWLVIRSKRNKELPNIL